MFKSRRSGLVRRLWRSRLVTESDGRDGGRRGEGGRTGSCGRHSGKLHRHEQRSVTHTDPALGLTGEAGELSESAERQDEEQPDDDRGAMCVQEHRGSRGGQEGDSRTVTCCLFGEWDLRPRSPYWASRKDGGGPCQCAPRHTGLEEELASTAHAFLKRLKERSLDTLLKAVEARGGVNSECVMVPSTELRLGAQHISPQSLLCKVFRWSDLPLSAWLKTLSHCQSFGSEDSAKVCCNPYHYSRLCGPGKDENIEGDYCEGPFFFLVISLSLSSCMNKRWLLIKLSFFIETLTSLKSSHDFGATGDPHKNSPGSALRWSLALSLLSLNELIYRLIGSLKL